MALDHTRPPPTLLRELEEVAENARDLADVLARGQNFPLPANFPLPQLADICSSLILLPHGTAEGCRTPLDYARYRLPAIRSQHISFRTNADEPTLVRGTLIDQRLGTLIISVTTAFDRYRELASEASVEEFKPEAIGDPGRARTCDPLLRRQV